MVKKITPLIIILLFAFLAGLALFDSGLHPTHDGEYHVIRFFEFNKAISDGNFYPRWAPDLNNGYGVPLFNYVYPLPNYIAVLLHTFGMSFIDSFKFSLFLSLVLSGIFFYLWSSQFWGKLGGVVSAVFYIFSPYHFVDIYIRGSVGESWALALFPAFLWSITLFIKKKQKVFLPLSSLFIALLVFSHNILALMFFVFGFFYVAFLIYKEKNRKALIFYCILIVALGLCLSAIFWLPALLEKGYVKGLEVFDIYSNFPLLYQLLIPSWGSGFSGGALGSQLSFQIGIANLLVLFLGIIFVLLRKGKSGARSLVIFFIVCFFIVFFLMLRESRFIWENIPLMNYFQFPWRFLSLEIVISAFLAGSVVHFGKFNKLIACFLIVIAVLLGIGYMKPAYYLDRNDNYYTTRSNFIDGTNSPGNAFNTIWMDNFQKQKDRLVLDKGNFSQIDIKSTQYVFTISSHGETSVLINTAYFPGWAAYVDGKNQKIQIENNGNFSFKVPNGKHNIVVRLEDTPIRKWSTILSLCSLFFVVLSLVVFIKIKK